MTNSIQPVHFDLTIRTKNKEVMVELVTHIINNHDSCNFSVENIWEGSGQVWLIQINDHCWRNNLIDIAKAIKTATLEEDEEELEEGEEEEVKDE